MAEDNKYKGIKLPALRKIAEEKGLEDYEDLERKELLEALIASDESEPDEEEDSEAKEDEQEEQEKESEAIKEQEESEDEDEEEEKPEKEDPRITEGRIPVGSKAAIMKARLALQPKVTVMIPKGAKEKTGTTFPVTINGYRMNIMKGVYVPVPKQVADIVMDSQNQTLMAADELKRVEDGGPIKLDGGVPSALE